MNLNRRVVIASAFAAALVAPGILRAQPAEMPNYTAEKCYGIAKAGKNDCASQGNNSCAGTARINSDPKAWLFVPEGVCERIVGASKEAK
ncbi:MAG: DUF2282 domain-containing protein [Acidobacteria bacterium]|nr:DUF2282 domain-containing protein [Acidobacteriota bacterium]